MNHFITAIRCALFLSLCGLAMTPAAVRASCAGSVDEAPSGTTDIVVESPGIETFTLAFEEPGLVAIEAIAPVALAGSVWVEVVPRICGSGTKVAFRTLARTASRQIILVEEPGALMVRVVLSTDRAGQRAVIDLVRYFLPIGKDASSAVGRKDGQGGDDDDGNGSEEADREIPPAPLPLGEGIWTATMRSALRWCTDEAGGRRDDSPFCSRFLPDGHSVTGTLDPLAGNQRDHHAIRLDEAAWTTIAVAADADLNLLVTDADGRAWLARTVHTDRGEQLVRLALPAGRYDLRVEATSSSRVAYALAVDSSRIR